MIKLLTILLCLFSPLLFAGECEDITHFQRLLIFNAKDQLMVVKIKNTEFWVTPGVYSQANELNHHNLHVLAADFGLAISPPKLRGVFSLKNKNTDTDSKRYFYNAQVNGGKIIKPDSIEEIKWLPLNEAMLIITFPHITMLLDQITTYPKVTWGGTILRYKQGNKLKSTMVKNFFPLTDTQSK